MIVVIQFSDIYRTSIHQSLIYTGVKNIASYYFSNQTIDYKEYQTTGKIDITITKELSKFSGHELRFLCNELYEFHHFWQHYIGGVRLWISDEQQKLIWPIIDTFLPYHNPRRILTTPTSSTSNVHLNVPLPSSSQ